MRRPTGWPLAATLLAAAAACTPPSPEPAGAVRPATPAAAGATAATAATAATGSDTAARRWTEADVRFVRGMIAHHAQALVMTALLPARTTREDMRLLAERITVSQRDEIALMRRWLERRGEAPPAADAHAAHGAHGAGGAGGAAHMEGGTPMPGMLTPAQLDSLAAASGTDFDRRFLEGMIRHHEGALTMVADLLATPGAGQEPELFSLASDIDADQRAEIRRMRALLDALPPRGGPSR